MQWHGDKARTNLACSKKGQWFGVTRAEGHVPAKGRGQVLEGSKQRGDMIRFSWRKIILAFCRVWIAKL